MADRDCVHGQLARVCDYCELEAEIADLRAQLEQTRAERDALKAGNDNARSAILIWMQTDAQLRETIARQREWIESAGHRPGCRAEYCTRDVRKGKCLAHKSNHPGGGSWHEFQPGPCDCGYAELVGG